MRGHFPASPSRPGGGKQRDAKSALRRAAGVLAAALFLATSALLATGCALPPAEKEAEALAETFRALHARVYEVYELPAERDPVWEHLAKSFAGEALTREYVEHYTTLERMSSDRTAIRILRVDYEDVEVEALGTRAARVAADWSVGGVVRHQGHAHVRINRYRARYELRREGEARRDAGPAPWRIVSTRLSDLERVRGYLGSAREDEASAGGFLSLGELLEAGLAPSEEELALEEPAEPREGAQAGDAGESAAPRDAEPPRERREERRR